MQAALYTLAPVALSIAAVDLGTVGRDFDKPASGGKRSGSNAPAAYPNDDYVWSASADDDGVFDFSSRPRSSNDATGAAVASSATHGMPYGWSRQAAHNAYRAYMLVASYVRLGSGMLNVYA